MRSLEQNRETGYRGNAVSSSVKNSVGERHRTERWRVGVGAGADRNPLETDECCWFYLLKLTGDHVPLWSCRTSPLDRAEPLGVKLKRRLSGSSRCPVWNCAPPHQRLALGAKRPLRQAALLPSSRRKAEGGGSLWKGEVYKNTLNFRLCAQAGHAGGG